MARGSVVVFLSQQAFQREKDAVGWLPLAKKGRCYEFNDWLYHKECVAKAHPVFRGLAREEGFWTGTIMGRLSLITFSMVRKLPAEVIAAAFAAGYSSPADMLPGYCWQGTGLAKGTLL